MYLTVGENYFVIQNARFTVVRITFKSVHNRMNECVCQYSRDPASAYLSRQLLTCGINVSLQFKKTSATVLWTTVRYLPSH